MSVWQDSPTDAEIRAEYGSWWGVPLADREMAAQVAQTLIDRGWRESIAEATHRVGVCLFGWAWPESGEHSVEEIFEEEN